MQETQNKGSVFETEKFKKLLNDKNFCNQLINKKDFHEIQELFISKGLELSGEDAKEVSSFLEDLLVGDISGGSIPRVILIKYPILGLAVRGTVFLGILATGAIIDYANKKRRNRQAVKAGQAYNLRFPADPPTSYPAVPPKYIYPVVTPTTPYNYSGYEKCAPVSPSAPSDYSSNYTADPRE